MLIATNGFNWLKKERERERERVKMKSDVTLPLECYKTKEYDNLFYLPAAATTTTKAQEHTEIR